MADAGHERPWALGARAELIGRPHLRGVACGGEEGVLWVLELYRREIDRALALGGWDSVAGLIFFRAGSDGVGRPLGAAKV